MIGITYTYTLNIGDEIQQVALIDILEKIKHKYSYQVNRDLLINDFGEIPENSKLIINGWLKNIEKNFEEYDYINLDNKNIKILYIGIYINEKFRDYIKNNLCIINHYKKHSPIGCADLSTLEFFQSLNIGSYFSGCLSLNLSLKENIIKYDKIYAGSEKSSIIDGLKLDHTILEFSRIKTIENIENRRNIARKILKIYEQSNTIETINRLHVYLPCRAYYKNIIFLDKELPQKDSRFKGLFDISNQKMEELKELQIYTIRNFLNNINVNQISNYTEYNRYPDIFKECQILYENKDDINILSYGCSDGSEVKTLKNLYFENSNITGIDINKELIDKNKLNNNDPKIKYITPLEIDGQFDIIFAMSVLCTWPNEERYKFEYFETSLNFIDKHLKVNGYLIIYNSKYILEDSEQKNKYIPIKFDYTDTGFVTKYDKKGNIIKKHDIFCYKKIL